MFLVLLVKGFLIGIAFIIPGLSGGTMAIYLGVYQPMLEAISQLFRHFRKSFAYLLPIGIGIVVSIVSFARVIGWLLDVNSFATLLFFVGLILGGMKKLKGQIDLKNTKKVAFLLAGLSFLSVILLFVGKTLTGNNPSTIIPFGFSEIIILLLLGAVTAATMIIPGVSGSALLMVLGYYSAIVTGVVGNVFDFSVFTYNLYVIAFFAIGGLLGILGSSIVLNRFIKKYPSESMLVIMGFLYASAIILFFEIRHPEMGTAFDAQIPIFRDYVSFFLNEWPSFIAGIFTLITGFYVSRRMIALAEQR